MYRNRRRGAVPMMFLDDVQKGEELVFTGMHQGLVGKKKPRIVTSLYIEVFTWTGVEAVSSWRFTGDHQEAGSSHLG